MCVGSVRGAPMTGSTADLRRNWCLIWGVTPRFWPEMKTLNL
jgi:hypothetical protein